MKKTDLAMIVFIASISMVVAYIIGNSIFGNIITKGEKVKTIAPISTTVEQPDPAIFNTNAINPSVEVQITDNTTTTSGTQ